MKTNQLISMFTTLSGSNKSVRYGQLMSNGFHASSIDLAVKATGANLSIDSEGYTVITF